MPKISPINWKEFEKFLLFIGCEYKRQKGDHRVYWRSDLKRPIVLPTYRSLPVMIIRSNLKTLSMDANEYLEILKKL